MTKRRPKCPIVGATSTNAAATHATRLSAAKIRIASIQNLLHTHEIKAKADPLNWGYAGDLGYVVEQLENIERFLASGSK